MIKLFFLPYRRSRVQHVWYTLCEYFFKITFKGSAVKKSCVCQYIGCISKLDQTMSLTQNTFPQIVKLEKKFSG